MVSLINALDVEGIVEYYPSRRTFVRFDFGDTIMRFGGTTFRFASGPRSLRLGTSHNFQLSAGVGLRF